MVPPTFVPALLTVALCLVIVAGTLRAAAPVNDNLVSAAVLDNDVPDTTSTTMDATLEAAEPLPTGYTTASYQATVWWQWSPVFSGWHELNTEGSAIDTVLAVWSDNNGAGPLTLVHVNDEAAQGSFSRIRFLADSSITYKVAVASRTTSRGPVTLTAFIVPDPISRVTAAAFTPASVEVASAGANISADVTLASSPSFQTGVLKLYSPTGTVLTSASVGAANRVSGNQVSGVYRMVLAVPQGTAAGTYRWGIHMADLAGTIDSSYGREGMTQLPPGLPDFITVLTPPASHPYTLWASSFSLSGNDALRTNDPDHDGTNNWMEYQSGLNPRQSLVPQLVVSGSTIVTMGLPQVSVVGEGDQMRLRAIFLRRLNDTSASAMVQFSDELSVWTNATQTPVVIAANATHEALMVEDELFVPSKPRRYARVMYRWLAAP